MKIFYGASLRTRCHVVIQELSPSYNWSVLTAGTFSKIFRSAVVPWLTESSSSLADREGQDPASEQTNKIYVLIFKLSQRKKTLFISHMYVQIKSPTRLRSSHSPFPFTPATQLTATRSRDTENGHFPQNDKAL